MRTYGTLDRRILGLYLPVSSQHHCASKVQNYILTKTWKSKKILICMKRLNCHAKSRFWPKKSGLHIMRHCGFWWRRRSFSVTLYYFQKKMRRVKEVSFSAVVMEAINHWKASSSLVFLFCFHRHSQFEAPAISNFQQTSGSVEFVAKRWKHILLNIQTWIKIFW